MNNFIGEKLKELRSKRNLSQETLAKALFFSNRTISNWENGLREISLENLQKIADYFQVPLTYFTTTHSPAAPLKGAYQQVKVKKIEISDRYFYGILTLLVINTTMIWIPFSNRVQAALVFMLCWIGVLIHTVTRYKNIDNLRTNTFFVVENTILTYVTPLADKARKNFLISNAFQYGLLSLNVTAFYVGIFAMMNLQNLDEIFNSLVVVFYFFLTIGQLYILIRSLLLGVPLQNIKYSKNQYDFKMFQHRTIVSLHYFMVIFFVIYLNAFAPSIFPLDLLLFNLFNGLVLIILLRVILVSNARFYSSYRLICQYSDQSTSEILV